MSPISDRDDPRLDAFRAVRDRDLRGDGGRFVVESPRVVARFLDAVLQARFEVESVVIDPAVAPELADHPATGDVPVHVADVDLLTAVSGYRFHAGALAIGRRPRRLPTVDEFVRRLSPTGPVLLGGLAGITSMDNMGGIFRTAAALGVDALLLDARCSDPLLRRCLRISMGQVFRMPWTVVNDLDAVIDGLATASGIESIAIENAPDAPAIHASSMPDRTLLIIGNEGHGVSPALLAACHHVRRIASPADLPEAERPGGEDERSLNAHVAAGIAFHEAIRRRFVD